MSRPHENDEIDVSFPTKTQTFENPLKSGKFWKREYRLRVDGLNSLKTQTFENDWSCDLSQSTCIQNTKMENIHRERIVVFIGVSLLLSLIVNWQLNNLNNVFYTCAVES